MNYIVLLTEKEKYFELGKDIGYLVVVVAALILYMRWQRKNRK